MRKGSFRERKFRTVAGRTQFQKATGYSAVPSSLHPTPCSARPIVKADQRTKGQNNDHLQTHHP